MCIRTWGEGREGVDRLLCNLFNSNLQLSCSLLLFTEDPEKRALCTPSSGLLKKALFVFLSTLSEHSRLSHTTSSTLIQLSSNSSMLSEIFFCKKNAKKHEKWRFFGPPCKPLFFVHFSKRAKFCSGVHRAFWPKNAFFSLFCLTPKTRRKRVFWRFLRFFAFFWDSCRIL